MLHKALLVIVGLVVFWLLTAIFETVALKNHPYAARILAAVIIIVSAYIGWGFQSWWQVLIVIGAGFAYLQVMKEAQHISKKKLQ